MAAALRLQPWRVAVLLAVVVQCILLVPPTNAQQLTPFIGQGVPPPEGIDIYVSYGLDRLLTVLPEKRYTFEVILFVMFSWTDARAWPAMEASTAAVAASNGTLACKMPCDTLWVDTACCDGVYLPHLELVNAQGMSQDRVVRYAIQFPPPESNSSAVAWWAHVQGEFYSNYKFVAYPFDVHEVPVQFQLANRTSRQVTFHGSASTLDMYANNNGDAISGWNINNISFVNYTVTDDVIMSKTTLSNQFDPYPLHPPAGDTSPRFVSYLWSNGFIIVIQISRISDYAVISIILPLMLSAILSLLVFAISPRHLDTRLGIVVTLFLSLTALMIVISDMLPESKTVLPTQQLALLGYFFLLFVSLESIWVYYIVRANKNYELQKRKKKARARFTRRWDQMKTMASRETTEAAAREAVKGATPQSGCAPWLRKRRPNADAAGGGEVAVPMPEIQQRPSPAARPPRRPQQQQQEQQGGEAPAGNGDELAPRRSSAVVFLPMGGVGDGDSSDAGSDFQAPGSELSEYASEDGGADAAAAPPDWWGRASSKYQAMWAEIKRNPDYALHIATRIDTWCFWFTCVGYIVAAVIILTANVSFQSAVRV